MHACIAIAGLCMLSVSFSLHHSSRLADAVHAAVHAPASCRCMHRMARRVDVMQGPETAASSSGQQYYLGQTFRLRLLFPDRWVGGWVPPCMEHQCACAHRAAAMVPAAPAATRFESAGLCAHRDGLWPPSLHTCCSHSCHMPHAS